MTPIDLSLFEFAENYTYYFDNSDSNPIHAKFIVEQQNCIQNEQFTHVDMQDEKGNTLLHYLFKNKHYNLCWMLLKVGANPFIKNNKNEVALKLHQFQNDFLPDEDINLEIEYFYNITHKMSSEFKQTLFLYAVKKGYIDLDTIDSMEVFLKKNSLNTIENQVTLLFENNDISLLKRLQYYNSKKKFHSIENNSLLFQFLDGRSEFHYVTSSDSILLKALETFLSLTFKDDYTFQHAIISGIDALDKDKENIIFAQILGYIIQAAVRNNFDFTRPVHGDNSFGLLEYIKTNSFTNSIYLNTKLQNDLFKEDSFTPKIKHKI